MSQIYNDNTNEYQESPESIKKFINEYIELCKKHNLVISHESWTGDYVIEEFSDERVEEIHTAHIGESLKDL